MFRELQYVIHCNYKGKKMKNFKHFYIYVLYILFTSLIYQCNEYEEPGMINTPTIDYADNPVISSISPSEIAVAGVRYITINGENFAHSGGQDTTKVFIGGERVTAESISDNVIVANRPVAYGDDLMIRVVVSKALDIAGVDGYEVEIPIEDF
jgi:hypothetical protein